VPLILITTVRYEYWRTGGVLWNINIAEYVDYCGIRLLLRKNDSNLCGDISHNCTNRRKTTSVMKAVIKLFAFVQDYRTMLSGNVKGTHKDHLCFVLITVH
jgi:hypothetical protein